MAQASRLLLHPVFQQTLRPALQSSFWEAPFSALKGRAFLLVRDVSLSPTPRHRATLTEKGWACGETELCPAPGVSPALRSAMKLLGLVAALAIIVFAYNGRLTPGKDSVDNAMIEFDKTIPAERPSNPQEPLRTATATAPATTAASPPSSNLRRPIDRTRAVLEQVKQRNGEGEF